MAKAKIFAGNCNFNTTVEALMGDDMQVHLSISSDCPHITKMAEEMKILDPFREMSFQSGEGPKVFEVMTKGCPHPSCPVFSGILRATEVAAGLALPTDMRITFE